MPKIRILDEKQEEKIHKCLKNDRKKSGKYIKIKDSLFKIGLRKELIEKYQHGYCLAGEYEELLHFNIKK